MKNNFFKSDSRFLLLSIFTVSVFPYNYPLTVNYAEFFMDFFNSPNLLFL